MRLGYIGTGGLDGGPWLVFGLGDSADASPMRDQLPLGEYEPGRWGWLLSDPQPPRRRCHCVLPTGGDAPSYDGWCSDCKDFGWTADPIPCKGRQGVFELPADVAEALSRGVAS